MTKAKVNPGACGFISEIEATEIDEDTIKVTVDTGCEYVKSMIDEFDGEFDVFDVCMKRPGTGPLYEYAAEHFPGHSSCIMIAAIMKVVEAEGHMSLPKNCSVEFED